MTSSFAWLDHSEQQRRQMLEIVNLFREKGTLDELGVGQIRDAFADHFFPGTTTIHTRARYLLFVPWIFTRLERRHVSSGKFHDAARSDQFQLVKALVAGGAGDGIIGVSAGYDIQRLPSAIYWGALRSYGIMRYPHSYEAYVRGLDGHYRSDRGALRSDDGELVEAATQTWDGGLPPAPDGLFTAIDFAFSRDESEYVRERIATQQPGSILAEFLGATTDLKRVHYPWTHPAVPGLSARRRSELAHAERFSLLAEGAYLLYNLMLAEAAVEAGMTNHQDRPERCRATISRWSNEMTASADLMADWDAEAVWRSLAEAGKLVSRPTRRFIEAWSPLALPGHASVADDTTARGVIRERERQLKGGLARLQNRRALENWRGDSSVGRLSFRWPNARQLIVDVQAGLRDTGRADA